MVREIAHIYSISEYIKRLITLIPLLLRGRREIKR